MAALAGGTHADTADTPLGRVNRIMAKHRLRLTGDVLIERVANGLKSAQPLTKEGKEKDHPAFDKIVTGVAGRGGLLGGPALSEAVLIRARSVWGSLGENLKAEAGITTVLGRLPSQAVRLGFLLDLSASEFGRANQALVLKAVYELLQAVKTIGDLVPAGTSRGDLVRAVEELNERLSGGFFPADITTLLVKRLAKLAQGSTEPVPAATLAPPPEVPSGPVVTRKDGVVRK